jgi:hypothetical protein
MRYGEPTAALWGLLSLLLVLGLTGAARGAAGPSGGPTITTATTRFTLDQRGGSLRLV